MTEKNKSTFCVLPWVSLQVRPDGRVAPCCYSKSNFSTDDASGDFYLYKDSLEAIFSSRHINNLRKNLLSGIKDENCARCWQEEAQGRKSKRQFDNEYFAEHAAAILDRNEILDQPIFMDVSPGTLCNLKCRICTPNVSSRWMRESLDIYGSDFMVRGNSELQSLSQEASRDLITSWPERNFGFWETMEKWLPKLELLSFYGGEPFLIKRHFDVLDKSIAGGFSERQSLRYNSNGTIYPEHLIENIFPRFKSVSVLFSLDGIGSQFEYQRHGAKWDVVLANVLRFREVAHERKNFFTGICFTVSAMNIHSIPETLDFWLKYDFPIYLSYVDRPLCFSASCLPKSIKQEVVRKISGSSPERFKKILINDLDSLLNMMNADERVEEWPRFLEVINKHDQYRKENFAEVFPEFWALIDKYESQVPRRILNGIKRYFRSQYNSPFR